MFLILGPVVMSQMRKIRGPVVPGTAEVLSLRCLSRPSRSKPTHTGRALVQVKSYRRQPQSRRVSGCRRPEVVRPPRDDASQPWQELPTCRISSTHRTTYSRSSSTSRNLASIAARAVQPVLIAQAPNLAIGLPLMRAVDAADPLRRFVVD